jgi:hypothetical protein
MGGRGLPIKCGLIMGAAMALSIAAGAAHAQGVPRGSYLRSCTHIETYGDRLSADCRRADGSWARTAIRDVSRCAGDIGNMDGQLTCNGGRPDYSSYGRPDYRGYGRPPGYGGPGYGSSGGYSYPYGYGR